VTLVRGRACTLLVIGALAAGMAQASAGSKAASDFDIFSVTPSQSQGPSWAGLYLRGNAPGGSGGSETTGAWSNLGTSNPFSSISSASAPVNDSFGYNFQAGNFVFGLEGALSAANFDGRFTSPFVPEVGGWTPNMNWVGTVTGRIGYSFGQWLPYVKGGVAAAQLSSPLQNGLINGFTQSSSERGGWTAGVGLEYQLSSKWSLGLEYLYTDLGGNSSGPPASIGAGSSLDVYNNALKTQSLLGRLNYKAGW
jgi:outer membrane immunogenic protein